MKAYIYLIFFLLSLSIVMAVEDCPLGMVNDTAPGSCVLYADKNADDLCDLSQDIDSCDQNLTTGDLDSTAIKSMTVKQVAEYYGINAETFAQKLSDSSGVKIKTTDSFQLLHDNYGVRPVNVREIATLLKADAPVPAVKQERTKSMYNSLWITIIAIAAYLISWFLSYKEKISVALHRKIWNWLLLISFIPVFLTSLFWILGADHGIFINVPFNISFWHVEFGIAMILISIFHIIWHTQYYFRR